MRVFLWLSKLPLGVLYAVTWCAYVLLYYGARFRRPLAMDNLRRAFPDKSDADRAAIAHASYRNGGELLAEVIKGADLDAEDLLARVRFENGEVLDDCLAAGRPVLLLASHHCNWEWLLSACCARVGGGVDAVYKPIRSVAADRFLHYARSRFGGHPIPAADFFVEAMRRRATTKVFAMVADQTPRHDEPKYWTQFLRQDTAFFLGPEKIAGLLKAPVVYVAMRRLARGRYAARFERLAEPPLPRDGTVLLERYARAAERAVLESPADWLWMYRKWKYPRPAYD
ncbi:MAG: lysophospholipid acyltransferase family protein [Burkholderiales bacterium]